MKTMTRTTYEHTLEIDDIVFPTEYPALDYIDAMYKIEDGLYTLVYAVEDDCPTDPIDDWDGMEWKEFRNSIDRDIFAQERLDEGYHVYVVDHFEHSGDLFRPLGKYPEARFHTGIDRWDSRPSVILAMHGDFIDPDEAAAAVCRVVTAYANGDTYGVVTETYRSERGRLVRDSEEACWGYYGSDDAISAIREAIA